MMMTSGSAVHYKSMFDAGRQIVAKEGTKSLFKGAGYVLYLIDRYTQFVHHFFHLQCQHSPWCCRCWCVVAVRQTPGSHVRQGLLRWLWISVFYKIHLLVVVGSIESALLMIRYSVYTFIEFSFASSCRLSSTTSPYVVTGHIYYGMHCQFVQISINGL